ncbi:hypothetical protein DFLDMN_005694 [Cupriavidus sp. H19C3]
MSSSSAVIITGATQGIGAELVKAYRAQDDGVVTICEERQ